MKSDLRCCRLVAAVTVFATLAVLVSAVAVGQPSSGDWGDSAQRVNADLPVWYNMLLGVGAVVGIGLMIGAGVSGAHVGAIKGQNAYGAQQQTWIGPVSKGVAGVFLVAMTAVIYFTNFQIFGTESPFSAMDLVPSMTTAGGG